jgi:predicted MFS family arabinose efflux permease
LFGWRVTMLVFAAGVASVSLPLIWFGCNRAREQLTATKPLHRDQKKNTPAKEALLSPLFWLLAISFTAINITHGMILTHLLPILSDRGVTAGTAVLVASMIGPMQVTGRIAMMAAERHVSIYAIAIGCFVFMGGAIGLLLGANGVLPLIFIFVILYGSAYGVTSIVRPVITAEVFGRENFGTISGMLALPFMFGVAISPTLSAMIWQIGGYNMVITTALIMVTIGMLTLAVARVISRRQAP